MTKEDFWLGTKNVAYQNDKLIQKSDKRKERKYLHKFDFQEKTFVSSSIQSTKFAFEN